MRGVPKKQKIQFFNDTEKNMTVRLNIAGTPPSAKQVKSKEGLLINMRSDMILVKLWEYDLGENGTEKILMFQDRGEKLP